MRRTLTLIFAATLLVTACGGSDSDSSEAFDTSTATDVPSETDDAPSSDEGTASAEDVADDTAGETAPPPTNPDKPTEIAVPGEGNIPTELVVTVLEEGTGEPAVAGDTVIVDYVGVRSLDGVEFDNSYDRFTPFSVGPLGSAPVIQGWNDGLIGARAGAQLQLDIPSDLAYGPAARSEVIRENEPLTFVIDIRSVITAPDPADAPTEMGVEPSEGATAVTTVDLREGDGEVLEEGRTAIFNLVLYRADNGVQLDTTWASEPIEVPMAQGSFPGLVEGMPGMAVGGRRAITIPPDLAFGPDGNPQIGLPAGTDIVLVVDLLGIY